MASPSALVVDDVVDMAETIANDLAAIGFAARVAESGAQALELFAHDPADVVVTDLRMKPVDGLDVVSAIKRADPTVPIIVMTAFGAIETAVEAMRRGAYHYLTKPFALETLRQLVQRCWREHMAADTGQLARSSPRPGRPAESLLGRSRPMQELRALIARVADAAAAVLISGETGSGKELVARAIHASGPRADQPFVALNCAALPEQLLESELFGHARGAFTGAATARHGLFVEAEGGTIFLDEIGDLPLALQGKLLRVLQSGEVRPVGSESTRMVDVRCIAATHKELGALVEQGLFREDLYFRLDVLRVPVPPLRERSEDIPILIEHFLRTRPDARRSLLAGFEPAALQYLSTCAWPGNVRQLENLVERLVVTSSAPLARVEDVERALASPHATDPVPLLVKHRLTLDDLESRYIAEVLKKVQGNKLRAAEILGVDQSTLYRRAKR